MIKSPFLLIDNFISPMECERILSSIDATIPNYNESDDPVKTIMRVPVFRNRIWATMEKYFDAIESYYNVNIDSITPVDLEWYPEDCVEEGKRCENSKFFGKKWMRVNDYDLTVIVFLKDYNDTPEFDEFFECYGGRLEIINHNFSFNPKRGMAVIFPSNQYFISRTQSPKVGDAFQLRMHLVCEQPFKYNPDNYRGNAGIWFKSLT